MKYPILFLVLMLVCVCTAAAKEEARTGPQGRQYYLYTPDQLQPGTTNWLVVGVHGAGGNGKGAAGLASWITKKNNVIVVGPSFPNGYQVLQLGTDTQLTQIFNALQKEFPLHPKMFMYGFSGGAQFAHRFTLRHANLVIGCSAHSGGTWNDSLGGAAAIPIAMSCGEADTAKSTSTCPIGRYPWAVQFAKKLSSANYFFKARFWPGVGHSGSPGSSAMTEDCFRLATTGMYEDELRTTDAQIEKIRLSIEKGQKVEAAQQIQQLKAQLPATDRSATPARDEGAKLPGLTENAHGWHENEAGKTARLARRKAYIDEQLATVQRKPNR
jgi:predicted esterase